MCKTKINHHFCSAPLTGRMCTTRCTTARSSSSPSPSSSPPTSRYTCFWKGGYHKIWPTKKRSILHKQNSFLILFWHLLMWIGDIHPPHGIFLTYYPIIKYYYYYYYILLVLYVILYILEKKLCLLLWKFVTKEINLCASFGSRAQLFNLICCCVLRSSILPKSSWPRTLPTEKERN